MRERILELINQEGYKRRSVDEIAKELGVESSEQFKELVQQLVSLEDEYLIARDENNHYDRTERLGFRTGKIQIHKKGYGFVRVGEDEPDIFIPAIKMNSALNGDVVLIEILNTRKGNNIEGEVKKIIERGVRFVIGVYSEDKGVGYVKSDDTRFGPTILINKNNSKGAMPDHKVKVEIIGYLEGKVEGQVVEILGHKNDPGIDILSIVYAHGIPTVFPPDVMDAANRTPETLKEEDYKGRRDLRNEIIVTIDGEDAKDLDDAVGVKKLENGNYLLSVHIADVSYYVREGEPMDIEAYRRGTSTYLVDRVIPMLPHRLSNGICSLNPQVDRLVISCEMEIDSLGNVVKHDIFPSVIKTTERMTYTNVNKILVTKDEEVMKHYESLLPMFNAMEELFNILNERRRSRGSINFETTEAKIIVDEGGKPLDVVLRTRDVAEKIIEEFMLIANETIAEHFTWMNLPFIYRVHEDPDQEKIRRFFQLLSGLGFKVKGTTNNIHPKALQAVLDEVEGEAEEAVINTVLLRSMQKARYSELSIGHYGLATKYYTHFTSPIRRYPDLIVHRLIREYLFKGNVDAETQEKNAEMMKEIGLQTSLCERRAIDCERDVEAMKKAEYMLDKIDMEFEGIISSVTNWGIYVELPNTIEGLVHVLDMTDDYYEFDEKTYSLVGERTKKRYRIGDQVKVKVIGASKEEKEIDFAIVGIQSRNRDQKEVTLNTGERSFKKDGYRKEGNGRKDDKGKRQGSNKKTRNRREKKLNNKLKDKK